MNRNDLIKFARDLFVAVIIVAALTGVTQFILGYGAGIELLEARKLHTSNTQTACASLPIL